MPRRRPEDSRYALSGMNFEEADALVVQSPLLFRCLDVSERGRYDMDGSGNAGFSDDFLALLMAIKKTANPLDMELSATEQAALSQAGQITARQLSAFERGGYHQDLQVQTQTLYNDVQVMSVFIASRNEGRRR